MIFGNLSISIGMFVLSGLVIAGGLAVFSTKYKVNSTLNQSNPGIDIRIKTYTDNRKQGYVSPRFKIISHRSLQFPHQ